MDNEQLGEPPGTPGPEGSDVPVYEEPTYYPGPQGYSIHRGYQGPKYPGYQGPVSYSEVCRNEVDRLQLAVARVERGLEAHIEGSEGSILTELLKFVGYVGTTTVLVKLFT
jgi:hypothetical protein